MCSSGLDLVAQALEGAVAGLGQDVSERTLRVDLQRLHLIEEDALDDLDGVGIEADELLNLEVLRVPTVALDELVGLRIPGLDAVGLETEQGTLLEALAVVGSSPLRIEVDVGVLGDHGAAVAAHDLSQHGGVAGAVVEDALVDDLGGVQVLAHGICFLSSPSSQARANCAILQTTCKIIALGSIHNHVYKQTHLGTGTTRLSKVELRSELICCSKNESGSPPSCR